MASSAGPALLLLGAELTLFRNRGGFLSLAMRDIATEPGSRLGPFVRELGSDFRDTANYRFFFRSVMAGQHPEAGTIAQPVPLFLCPTSNEAFRVCPNYAGWKRLFLSVKQECR